MLRKLMKHELRATARTIWPTYLAVILLTGIVAMGIRVWESSTSTLVNILAVLATMAYSIAISAVFIVVLVMMVNRFKNNLLQDEGYVMFTLPVSSHQIIWSKIIISCLWFVVTTAVAVLSVFIVATVASYEEGMLVMIWNSIVEAWKYYAATFGLNGVAIAIEALVLCFVSYAAGCLIVYAAMATGYSFDRRKGLLSVLIFIGFMTAMQIVGAFVMANMDWSILQSDSMAAIHASFGLGIGLAALQGAVFYVITTQMLRRRLNIE